MRNRKWGPDDLAYSEAHRKALPELYGRIGHRLAAADRDVTEFCHFCKTPLGIYEEVRDVGQRLEDKATTITRKLARETRLPAFLFAWRVDRPAATQARIDALGRELLALQCRDPLVGFRAKQLHPRQGPWVDLTPEQWWLEGVLVLHRAHHRDCPAAEHAHPVAHTRLIDAMNASRLWTPRDQLALEVAA